MKAFDQGADGVIVLGCHIGECHYDSGNHRTAKRLPILKSMMAFTGLDPERIHLDWVSASEAERFAHIVTEFVNKIRKLGPVEWRFNSVERPIESKQNLEIKKQIIGIGNEWADINKITKIQKGIQAKARELLESESVKCVIGYETGTRGRTRPVFVYDPNDVDRLIWSQACTYNLTTYIQATLTQQNNNEKLPRVGVVAKPCDSKSINVLVSENRFKRDQVYVIGIACDGIREGAALGSPTDNYQTRCMNCTERTPIFFDTLIGDPSGPHVNPLDPDYDLNIIDALTPKARMEFWLSQFDRCIRCYACRQVCPMCSCPTCLYERDDSLWVSMNIEVNQKRTFHLGRAYHLAGRCIGCNECERVCPMDIPIGLLNRKIAKEIQFTFGFQAGLDAVPSPITTVLDEQEGGL
jgi:NAD-dependent dihydropyrimidine dehydrogenase PreA subunit